MDLLKLLTIQSRGRLIQILEGDIDHVHFHAKTEHKTYNYLVFKYKILTAGCLVLIIFYIICYSN